MGSLNGMERHAAKVCQRLIKTALVYFIAAPPTLQVSPGASWYTSHVGGMIPGDATHEHQSYCSVIRLRGGGIDEKLAALFKARQEGRPGMPWGVDDPRWEIPPSIPCRKPPMDMDEDEESESLDTLMEWMKGQMTDEEKAQGDQLAKKMREAAMSFPQAEAEPESAEPSRPPPAPKPQDFQFDKQFEERLQGWAEEGATQKDLASVRRGREVFEDILDALLPANPNSSSVPPAQHRAPNISHRIFDRIHSLDDDSSFVEQVASTLAVPLVGVLPRGVWLRPPLQWDAVCSFKGHSKLCTSPWVLRHPNIELALLAAKHSGCVVVDTCTPPRPNVFPPSLAVGLPMWAALVNRAVHRRRRAAVNAGEGRGWDVQLHLQPTAAKEHGQSLAGDLEELQRGFETRVGSRALEQLAGGLEKPLRPLWLDRRSFAMVAEWHNTSLLPFTPIYCLSASLPASEPRIAAARSEVDPEEDSQWSGTGEGGERKGGGGKGGEVEGVPWRYIPGAADGVGVWGRGLTLEQFWLWKDALLSKSEQALEEMAEGGWRELQGFLEEGGEEAGRREQMSEGAVHVGEWTGEAGPDWESRAGEGEEGRGARWSSGEAKEAGRMGGEDAMSGELAWPGDEELVASDARGQRSRSQGAGREGAAENDGEDAGAAFEVGFHPLGETRIATAALGVVEAMPALLFGFDAVLNCGVKGADGRIEQLRTSEGLDFEYRSAPLGGAWDDDRTEGKGRWREDSVKRRAERLVVGGGRGDSMVEVLDWLWMQVVVRRASVLMVCEDGRSRSVFMAACACCHCLAPAPLMSTRGSEPPQLRKSRGGGHAGLAREEVEGVVKVVLGMVPRSSLTAVQLVALRRLFAKGKHLEQTNTAAPPP